jgi:hypothetical protein
MKKRHVIAFLCILFMLVAAASAFGQVIPGVKTVTVRFTSNAPKAQVFMNDKLIGLTPFTSTLPYGGYTMRVVADGYEPLVQQVQLRTDTTLNLELKPIRPVREPPERPQHREYSLSVDANVRGAKVFIDDRQVGNVPFRGRVPEGQHSVRVVAEGFEEYAKTLDVNGDVRLNADLRRIRRTFTLSIQANADGAKVSINGQEQNGFAPMDVRLEEGRYTIKVTRPGYGGFETTVDLNRDLRIDARLIAPKAKIIIIPPEQRGRNALRLDISLDGRPQRGTTFEVERGRHVVRVEAGGLSAERTVDCREGRVYRFKLDLDLQAPNEADN